MQPPSNTGSFGNGQMSPELQAAITRRGNQGSSTSAVMTSAPTFNPSTQVPNTPPSSINVPSQPPSESGMGLPANTPESQLIIKALDARLKSLSKVQESGGTI